MPFSIQAHIYSWSQATTYLELTNSILTFNSRASLHIHIISTHQPRINRKLKKEKQYLGAIWEPRNRVDEGLAESQPWRRTIKPGHIQNEQNNSQNHRKVHPRHDLLFSDVKRRRVLPNQRRARRRSLFRVAVPDRSPNKNVPGKPGYFRRDWRRGKEESWAGGSVWFGKQTRGGPKRERLVGNWVREHKRTWHLSISLADPDTLAHNHRIEGGRVLWWNWREVIYSCIGEGGDIRGCWRVNYGRSWRRISGGAWRWDAVGFEDFGVLFGCVEAKANGMLGICTALELKWFQRDASKAPPNFQIPIMAHSIGLQMRVGGLGWVSFPSSAH